MALKIKQNIVLIAAVACGLVAAVLANTWLRGKNREFAELRDRLIGKVEKVDVVVAARTLPKGTVIQVGDIGQRTVFKNGLHSGAIAPENYERIVGRKLANTLEASSPILWSDIEGGQVTARGLSSDIRTGMRAVSIAVSGANAVSGLVLPNDTVDVLGTFVFGSEGDLTANNLVTLTVLQNVTVLATGTDTAKTLTTSSRAVGGYSTVTLEVTPREAEILVFAQQLKGRLTLTLRNPTDVTNEQELPRIDFKKIEGELQQLNEYRQKTIRGRSLR